MTTAGIAHFGDTVLALRQEFDLAFARTQHTETAQQEGMLAIRLGGTPYAIRMSEIGGLHVDRRITPLPTPVPQLLGVTGLRGQIAPVYDLASLCGHARAPSTRWLILLKSREPVTLAFESFEKHFSVTPDRIFSTDGGVQANAAAPQAHLMDAVRMDDSVRPIIHLQSLLQKIRQLADSFIQKRRGQA